MLRNRLMASLAPEIKLNLLSYLPMPRLVDGFKLTKPPPLSPTRLALLAWDLHHGEVSSSGLPRRKAARLLGVPERDLCLIENATELEYAALRRGNFTIEALREQHRQQCQHPSDAEIDKLVERIGVGKMLDALDRATAPTRVAAE